LNISNKPCVCWNTLWDQQSTSRGIDLLIAMLLIRKKLMMSMKSIYVVDHFNHNMCFCMLINGSFSYRPWSDHLSGPKRTSTSNTWKYQKIYLKKKNGSSRIHFSSNHQSWKRGRSSDISYELRGNAMLAT
jgi:hypothetical protein